MANTYTQIYIHIVFAVKNRASLIPSSQKTKLYRYITGIVQQPQRRHKLYAINGMSDHLHLLIGIHPAQAISNLIRDIKANSAKFINSQELTHGHFSWQVGYGAFSYAQSQLPNIINYIRRQEKHHAKHTFQEEYKGLLERFAVRYDPEYLFDWIDDI